MRATSGNLNRVPLAPKPRWAVLISGRGSNLSSLLLNTDFDIRLVVSSSDSAEGLLKARRAGVPTRIAPTKRTLTGKTKLDFEKLSEELAQCGITHVLLAGFMKIVPASFVSRWNGKILNLHPSMLPLYPGLDSIQNAFAAGADMGVTVHEVNE
ncbi:MAG: formyltransferase family protein, partial [Bdellovibrionota bacterium]